MPDPCLTELRWAGSCLRVAGRVKRAAAPAGVPEVELLLRERDGGCLLRVPASVSAADDAIGFEAMVDVASIEGGYPLPGGLWDVHVAMGGPADCVVLPLGRDRAAAVDASPQRRFLPGSSTVTAYFGFQGGLAIDVGGRPHAAGSAPADLLAWDERDEEVSVTGHLDLQRITMPISGTLNLLERRTRRSYQVFATLEELAGRLGYTARVPVTRAFIDDPLPRGTWDVTLRLGFSGLRRELRVLAPGVPVDVQVWRRLRHVRVVSSTAPDPLTITVGRG
ncbi:MULTISPECIES: hypothetical protein [Actinomadura]|uniref:Uncharacterized protein n=1 Tax=Actinomadura litoris TaxID=2678616 RepID=A0A7K1KV15_9ACTN|nr:MULTISPECIES: hypothetical protein [Actinomadura]MBT2211103.1 hypothetical protein [Actinomadura sp. NEAU-AAG7]MUN36022.1 hypothetical protein [Actinomadura litoris]